MRKLARSPGRVQVVDVDLMEMGCQACGASLLAEPELLEGWSASHRMVRIVAVHIRVGDGDWHWWRRRGEHG